MKDYTYANVTQKVSSISNTTNDSNIQFDKYRIPIDKLQQTIGPNANS